jgi:hypothetical protein
VFTSQVRALLTAGVLAAAFPVSASAAPLTLFDGTFDSADWIYINQSTGSMTTDTSQAATGGNPDESRQTSFAHPAFATFSDSLITLNINDTFEYDPGIHGAITNLEIAFDVRTLNGGVSHLFFMGLLEQGGQYYRTNQDILSSGAWSSFVVDASAASDWDLPGGAAGAPDFSATGGVIRFGYRIGSRFECFSTSGCPAIDGVVALDNFKVSISGTRTAPEPATAVLLLTGLAGVIARRRR